MPPAAADAALRIVVLGCPGSGKSHLARAIGEAFDLPTASMDELIGVLDGRRPQREWHPLVESWTARPRWCIDGNVLDTLELRAARATLVVLVRTPRLLCLLRVRRRSGRPEAPVPFSWPLARYVLRYGRSRRQHLARVRAHHTGPLVVVPGTDVGRALAIIGEHARAEVREAA